MNRIERLLWETRMNGIERSKRESHATTGAKVMSIVLLVGMITLFATRPPLPPVDESNVRAPVSQAVPDAPVIVPSPAGDRTPAAETPSGHVADAASSATR